MKVRGILFDIFDDAQGIRACIRNPVVRGDRISDHVWVVGCINWLPFKHLKRCEVEFEAEVNTYHKSDGTEEWGFCKAGELSEVQPPALLIPTPPKKRPKRPLGPGTSP
jgi:hypothetical protein